jgi:hypothetical protein
MDLGSWWILDVIGPVLLLLVLIWLILNLRSNRNFELKGRSELGARERYQRGKNGAPREPTNSD